MQSDRASEVAQQEEDQSPVSTGINHPCRKQTKRGYEHDDS
jgi:hypothetical protein